MPPLSRNDFKFLAMVVKSVKPTIVFTEYSCAVDSYPASKQQGQLVTCWHTRLAWPQSRRSCICKSTIARSTWSRAWASFGNTLSRTNWSNTSKSFRTVKRMTTAKYLIRFTRRSKKNPIWWIRTTWHSSFHSCSDHQATTTQLIVDAYEIITLSN